MGGARDVVADLTDDVLVDILSRVPVKSLCLCKSVCRRWRDLIHHPEHRKKLPHTLTGFFYGSYDRNRISKSARHFINVSGAGDSLISLSFLPEYESIDIEDSCNGLLLCRGWKPTDPVTMDYVVCNPAAEKWVVVPDSGWSCKTTELLVRIARLGFDPAVSTHFHVFEFIPDDVWHMDDPEMDDQHFRGSVEVVATYSSKTGVWSFIEDVHVEMDMKSKSVFFNGVLHLTTCSGMVLAIDVEGNTVSGIPVPIPDYSFYDEGNVGDVYLSQGHLYFSVRYVFDGSDAYGLSVWVLDDYNSQNWSLKHNVNPLDLFGACYYSKFEERCRVISIHPECSVVFMVCGNTLMSYEMDHRRLCFLSRLSHHWTPCIPYVPLFSGSLADEH